MKHEDAEERDDHDGEDDVGEVEERLAPQHHVERDVRRHGRRGRAQVRVGPPGGKCITMGLPGKLILRDFFQENETSRRPFLLLGISFPKRPIFIQLPPGMNCITISLPGKLILSERKGLREVRFS